MASDTSPDTSSSSSQQNSTACEKTSSRKTSSDHYVRLRCYGLVFSVFSGYLVGFFLVPLLPAYESSYPFTTGFCCALIGLFVGTVLWNSFQYREDAEIYQDWVQENENDLSGSKGPA